MYSFARSLALRSSPAGGGDYMIGNIPLMVRRFGLW
jgi:hypothetical protein